jgi:flagellar hook-associated protein 2
MSSINLSGLASGFDWSTFVDQMVEVEQAPEKTLRTEQNTLTQSNNAYGSIKTELGVLSNRVADLQQASFFATRLAASSDTTIASATAAANAALGQYTIDVSHLATASVQSGAADIGAPLVGTSGLGVALSAAPFATAVTAGTFTVNGKQVTIATTDTLQQVFDKISAATQGAVTARYNSGTGQDTFTLSSATPIVLGSATDTSNFLLAAKLHNNGTGSITSTAALGAVQLSSKLASANLATAVSDGGSGNGAFKINGVTITFSTAVDSLANVIDRINSSAAGVTASYDALTDRMVLTNRTTGDLGIGLQDVTGNFLAATGLSTGTLQRGDDLEYTVNGGGTLTSHSNTISPDDSGLAGLTLTVSKQGTATINVASDTATIKKAITDFIDEFNKVQSLIDTNTTSSTDSSGKVTAGTLANDSDADEIASTLRNLTNSTQPDLAGLLKSLNDIGIVSNGYDNTLKVDDDSKLDYALANHLSDVQALFTDSKTGLATSLSAFLDRTIGENGTLVAKQAALTKQASSIDTQIADMERVIQADKERMIEEFTAMETAQATINQQLSYLLKTFGGSSSSSS